jgi:PhnB protein
MIDSSANLCLGEKMIGKVKAIPDGYHTITLSIIVQDAARAIDFYQKAFGAREIGRMTSPDGKKIVHAEIKIGDSPIMLSDEFLEWGTRSPLTLGGTSTAFFLYVENVDAAFQQAVDAGAKVVMPPADMFWGDRFGKLTDPFGHEWGMATHREEVSPEEMKKRGDAFFKQTARTQSV